MRSKFKWIFTLLVALTMQFSFAQEKTVTGVVSDNSGPLPGVNIVVKGTTRGTQTDLDGKYSIKTKVGETLVFSFIGMEDQSKTVGAANTMSVKLASGSQKLEEVVVQGYGKVIKKERLNGSVASVGAAAIQDRPNVNFLQSIQGQAAGVAIAFNSGQPGSNKVDVIIRGESSLNASADPLYVIDGVPLNQSFFRNLNPNDIENVTILKDAAASSVYGNRGANGVIVITTKKGKYNNSFSVNYSSMYGIAALPLDHYDLMNGDQLLNFQRDELPSIGVFGVGATTPLPSNVGYGVNTDWRKVYYRRAISKQHNLSFTSGGEKLNNYTSFGYLEQEGLLKNTDFKRFTFRTNFNGKSTNDRFTYSTNFNGNFSKRRQVLAETTAGITANIVQNPINGFLNSPGFYMSDWYQSGQQVYNEYQANVNLATPYTLMDLLNGDNLANFYNEVKIFANAEMSYKLTKHLTYGFNLGIDYQSDKRVFANGPNSYLAIVRNLTATNPLPFAGLEDQVNVYEFSADIVNKLNYNITLKEKHTIDLTLYSEYSKAHRRVNQFRQNGLDPLTWEPGAGTGYIAFNPANPTAYNKTVSASQANAGLFSYFAVLDYDYNSLFGIGASIRRDNSFKFTDDNKWGTFWSASARVNLHKFDFINKTGLFNELKLRASYGTSGNQNITARDVDATISAVFLNPSDIRDLNSTQAGYQNTPSVGVNVIANKDLKWETIAQANIGIDWNVKGRFSGSFDWYKKNTTDLYLPQPISAVNIPYTFPANGGELENRGIELALRYKIFKKENFHLDVYANAAKNTNEIKELPLAAGASFIPVGGQNIHQVGGPAGQYYVVPYVGVDPTSGQQLFLDINGNITETPVEADRRPTGRNYLPIYQGGFGLDVDYHGFFLNSYFTFTHDFIRFDDELFDAYSPVDGEFNPVTTDLLNAWTPTNTNTDVPSLVSGDTQYFENARSDRFLVDSSYLRLKTVTFGYNFPDRFLKPTFLKGVKLYVQAENWLTWTRWRGIDPEGFDADGQGKYPNARSVSFGLDLKF